MILCACAFCNIYKYEVSTVDVGIRIPRFELNGWSKYVLELLSAFSVRECLAVVTSVTKSQHCYFSS